MNAELLLYKDTKFERNTKSHYVDAGKVSLVLGFGEKNLLINDSIYHQLKEKYPNAQIVICSTSGEIYDELVYDNTVVVTAIEFEKTPLKTATVNIADFENSSEAGAALMSKLLADDLAYVMIISDGTTVNGSELVKGIESVNHSKVPVTGGLAGDAANFDYTLVGLNETPQRGKVVAIGFYGNSIRVGHGSMGGWDIFGLERTVTRSVSNKLFEIDHKNALELYKLYLGTYIEQLPGSALLFPLSVKMKDTDEPIVRTIISIDNDEQSMTFAGDVPEGSNVRFMKANFDKLIDAANQAASKTFFNKMPASPTLALLISCVGRKVILENRTYEEVEAIQEVFGKETLHTGFYSYGEISPLMEKSKCELLNQTMTITTFNEL